MPNASFLLLFTEVSDRGGLQLYAKHFINALLSSVNGAQVTVLLLNNTMPPEVKPGYSVKFICCGPVDFRWRKLKFISYALWQILSQRPDLIICNHIAISQMCVVIKALFKIEYDVVINGVEILSGINGFLRNEGLKRSRRIISLSEYLGTKANEQIKGIGSKVVVVHPPIDERSFYPMARSAELSAKYALDGSNVLLTAARVDSRKGFEVVIRALRKVLDKFANTKYLIVGQGDYTPELEALAKRLGVEEQVIFVGFVPHEQLVNYYNLCDVFIMPSKKEGFGMVFLEALACGRPVIAGNQEGPVEALQNGKLGILVDPNNEEEIEHAIIKVLRGEVDKRLLNGEYLRRKTLEVYGLDKFRERVKELIEEAAL